MMREPLPRRDGYISERPEEFCRPRDVDRVWIMEFACGYGRVAFKERVKTVFTQQHTYFATTLLRHVA